VDRVSLCSGIERPAWTAANTNLPLPAPIAPPIDRPQSLTSPLHLHPSPDGLRMAGCPSNCPSDFAGSASGLRRAPKSEYGGRGIRTPEGLHLSGFQTVAPLFANARGRSPSSAAYFHVTTHRPLTFANVRRSSPRLPSRLTSRKQPLRIVHLVVAMRLLVLRPIQKLSQIGDRSIVDGDRCPSILGSRQYCNASTVGKRLQRHG
jgi:hypothetical protein